jgi:hypothetical protein
MSAFGPKLQSYDCLAELLALEGLNSVSISTHSAIHRVDSVDTLWEAGLGSLARTGTVIRSSLAEAHIVDGALVIPVSFKVGTGLVRKGYLQPDQCENNDGGALLLALYLATLF